MATKVFDPNLFRKNDKKAKEWIRGMLPSGYVAMDNPIVTGVDLQIFRNGKHIFNIEPEIKNCWKAGQEFQYETLNIPVRKSKYCYFEQPTLFIVFRDDGKEYFCVWDRILVSSEIKEVPNKYVHSGELFFGVKISEIDKDLGKALKRKYQRKTPKAG